MGNGNVEGIFVATVTSGPIERVEEVSAVAGAGLEGDRTWQGELPVEQREAKREITLFAKEGVDRVTRDTDLELTYEDLRRNIMTTGIDLMSLIGKRFRVGDVELEGIKIAHPCLHLQELAGKPLMKPLMEDAGIRARIVTSGSIRVGDPVVIDPD